MADLSVTQANPGNISGVITNPTTPNINGVVSANPGSISNTSTTPAPQTALQGGSSQIQTYTPQPATANPQTTTNPQGLGAGTAVSPNAVQTFQFGDGSVYNSLGQMVSGPTINSGYTGTPAGQPAVQTGAPASLNTPTPDTTQNSSATGNDTGYSDIMNLLNENIANMDQLFSNMSQYATVGPDEQAQQQKVANDQAAMTGLGYQAQGLYNPNNQSIALPFLQGQAQNKLVGAGIQSSLDQSVLNYMQGNRQFAFNSAATIFNASQQNLQTALDAYTKMAPQNVGTNYNPTTGQLTAIMRNPVTGATYTGNLGNIGAQHSFTSTNITTDPQSGALTFVGTTSDGQVIQEPIGAGASYATGSSTNPIQNGVGASGNFTQTGNPQAGISTFGNLLGNWTSGQSTQLPGNGYQQAVYQAVSQATGTPVDASTPVSTLVSNIPAISQGIAKAENVSPSLLSATNNPGAILYANQPNAVPYKDSNGKTYAKFDTLQDGWNAMNNLVAQKLGAAPTPANPSSDLQQTIKTLPPTLQAPGTIKYLSDGTPFFDGNQIPSSQQAMAQFYSTKTGIPYVNGDNATKLNGISVAQQNISDLSTYASKVLMGGGVLGKIGNIIQGSGLNSFFGSTVQTNFNTYRNLAISSLESLVGGSGTGLRITAGEIASQIDNLPASSDTPGQAQAKIDRLNSQLNMWTSQILPAWKPSSSNSSLSTSSGIDYTQTLNNLMAQGNQ